jgi:hypothetical protein
MGIEGKMMAATGFQKQGYEKPELVNLFKSILSSKEKLFEFSRKSLRSAKDIFDKGGHVTKVIKDQTFRLFFDNRREMIFPADLKAKFQHNLSKILLDGNPLRDVNQCKTLRFISKFPITVPFNKNNTNRAQTKYKNDYELVIRNFIKAYFSKNEKFGLKGTEFVTINDLIKFIHGISSTNQIKSLKISKQSVSNLKNRRMIWRPVERTITTEAVVEQIKFKLPHFKDELFLKG